MVSIPGGRSGNGHSIYVIGAPLTTMPAGWQYWDVHVFDAVMQRTARGFKNRDTPRSSARRNGNAGSTLFHLWNSNDENYRADFCSGLLKVMSKVELCSRLSPGARKAEPKDSAVESGGTGSRRTEEFPAWRAEISLTEARRGDREEFIPRAAGPSLATFLRETDIGIRQRPDQPAHSSSDPNSARAGEQLDSDRHPVLRSAPFRYQ